VLCGFAIFFFPQLSKAMAEFRRVLKPTGKICISTFNKEYYNNWDWFYEIVETYLPTENVESQEKEADTEPQPVFDTPEGLMTILNSAGFDDVQVFSEKAEFIYKTEEDFWSTLWSHCARGILEKIEQESGADGLQKFKLDVFKNISAIKQPDGLHEFVSVHICLATKPKD
jgi:SAM-dependent methyltransferase